MTDLDDAVEAARQEAFEELYAPGCDYDPGYHAGIPLGDKICESCANKANTLLDTLIAAVEACARQQPSDEEIEAAAAAGYDLWWQPDSFYHTVEDIPSHAEEWLSIASVMIEAARSSREAQP